MMMGHRRDVAAILLLVHLMTLSDGINTEGNGAVEGVVSKNISIIIIDDKADSLLDTANTNVTSLNSANNNNNDKNNDSMVPSGTVIKNDGILEELEEAIENAAISGEVILLSPPGNRTDSTMPPLIIIENVADTSRLVTMMNKFNDTIEESIPKMDQEIAQSQNHLRLDRENYKDDGDSENVEDLIAIAEYEPQRIDATRAEDENPQPLSEPTDFDGLTTTIRPPTEETHYDVPKRITYSTNLHRIVDVHRSTTTRPDLTVSSTGQVQQTAGPSKLDLIKIERKDTKTDIGPILSPSTFYREPTAARGKLSGGAVDPKIAMLAKAKSSIPRKFDYHLSKYINSLAMAKPVEPKSTATPGSPSKIEAPSRNIRNLIDGAEPLITKNVLSSRVRPVHTPSPSPYRSDTSYHASFGTNVSTDPISPTSGSTPAARRVDDELHPRYVESSNHVIQPKTNGQLGFFTRYNLPSLVTGKLTSSRSYPVPSRNSRTGSTEEAHENENQSDGRSTPEPKSSRRSSTLIHVNDSYNVDGRTTTTGKRVVDHPNGRPAYNAITSSVNDPYEEVEEEIAPNNRRSPNTAHQRYGKRPVPSTTPGYDDYEIPPRTKPVRPSPIASTTPPRDSYEDYKEPSSSKSAKNSPAESYEVYDESAEDSKIARNSLSTLLEDDRRYGNSKIVGNRPTASHKDYRESENLKVTRTPLAESYESYRVTEIPKIAKKPPVVTPTPVYDFYNNDDESNSRRPLPQPESLIVNDPEPPRTGQINSYPFTTHSRAVQQTTPINLSDNPIYQLHGLRSSPLPVNGVHNPYMNYSARNPLFLAPPESPNTQTPRETVSSHRFSYTTPVSVSHEETSRANSPSASLSRSNNHNYMENQFPKTFLNIDNKIIENESTTRKVKNFENFYRDRGSKQWAVSPVNAIPTSPSRVVPQPRRDLNRAGRVSPTVYVESDESREHEESVDRRGHSSDTGSEQRNLRASTVPHYRESHDRASNIAKPATFNFHENRDRSIVPSTSNRPKSIEPHSADYGNRLRTRVDEERRRERIVAPSSTHASSTTPGRRGHGRTASSLDDDEPRLPRKHVDEVPAETANRASVDDSSNYEDEVPASSGHEEKHENYKTHEEAKNGGHDEHEHEEGGGEKTKEDHHASHGEKGDKGYKVWHEHDKGEKGHHDKESHDKEYDEKKGEKKKHEEESDYHKEHHHEEKGEKEAEFGEKGEHQKGHSTKGQHVVHKKDEYEKKTEFYDESHEEDGEEKDGGYGEEHEYVKGGHEKIGHHDSAHHEDKYGKKGEHEKGHHYDEHEGHKNTNGHDEHHHHEEKYGKKSGHEEGNKWSHKKGDNGKKGS